MQALPQLPSALNVKPGGGDPDVTVQLYPLPLPPVAVIGVGPYGVPLPALGRLVVVIWRGGVPPVTTETTDQVPGLLTEPLMSVRGSVPIVLRYPMLSSTSYGGKLVVPIETYGSPICSVGFSYPPTDHATMLPPLNKKVGGIYDGKVERIPLIVSLISSVSGLASPEYPAGMLKVATTDIPGISVGVGGVVKTDPLIICIVPGSVFPVYLKVVVWAAADDV